MGQGRRERPPSWCVRPLGLKRRLQSLAPHALVCVGTELLPLHGLVAGAQAFETASLCPVVLLDLFHRGVGAEFSLEQKLRTQGHSYASP